VKAQTGPWLLAPNEKTRWGGREKKLKGGSETKTTIPPFTRSRLRTGRKIGKSTEEPCRGGKGIRNRRWLGRVTNTAPFAQKHRIVAI